jgi:hypothetical protein
MNNATRCDARTFAAFLSRRWSKLMLGRILIATAAAAMLVATFIPDDAFARGGRGGGMRAGGFHGGGAVRAGGYRGGAVAVRGSRGGAVAVRGGRYGYRGAYAYRGYGAGAAAVGAAAVGAAAAGAYYRGGAGCGYDTYGNWVCPGGYGY